MFRVTVIAAVGVLIGAVLASVVAAAATPATWTQALPLTGVFDVAGPRADGRLVVGAPAGRLLLLDPRTGEVSPFASGANGYSVAGGEEPYFALSPGLTGQGCGFARDDLFVLQLKPAGGVLRIDASGAASVFATVPGVDGLNGIAFDATGRFGHRLLVTGPHGGRTTVAAIDCAGTVSVITTQAPVLEGGLAVAPADFGAYGGDLVAPDELSGNVYAIAPDGTSRTITHPDLATGGDIGVEGAGFIPAGPVMSLTAYFADRGTPGNLHPGTDHLLALSGESLAAAGARTGDLLVGTEGGGGLVGIRCASTCSSYPIVEDNAVSHGEGKVLVAATAPGSAFATPPAAVRTAAKASAPPPMPLLLVLAAIAVLAAAGVVFVHRRR